MINTPKYELPKMPFSYDREQADSIMRAMLLNYRMDDVLCFVHDKEWFIELSDEQQLEAVRLIAERVERLIADNDDYWTFAVDFAEDEYLKGKLK